LLGELNADGIPRRSEQSSDLSRPEAGSIQERDLLRLLAFLHKQECEEFHKPRFECSQTIWPLVGFFSDVLFWHSSEALS